MRGSSPPRVSTLRPPPTCWLHRQSPSSLRHFIGRTGDEILQASNDWETGTRFGEVHGYDGARLHAPALPGIPPKARGRVR
ncbi:hypothetical protein ADK60_01170 [Streptomyces sp. XY431]|nr:hypothetical protein ADK60_01170 [Streptomyces sp. XY431]